ncbi:MAG: biotin/lipoyl-containing protein [Lutisporaceae bacterium]
MRKFKINVNGKSYEVEVEEVRDGAAGAPVVASAAPKAVSAPKATPAPAPKAAPVSIPAGANTVVAPMPGTILSINVKAGDTVKKGQILCILEAMKMENEIMSGIDATVTSVAVNQGDSVNTGQVLVVLG